jgi:hypothetical protein
MARQLAKAKTSIAGKNGKNMDTSMFPIPDVELVVSTPV